MTKQVFRKKYLSVRNQISSAQKKSYDKILTDKIISLPEFKTADRVLLFASVGSEVNTWEVFRKSVEQNKKVYFPKCIDGEKMEFFRAFSESDFSKGKFGIPEPAEFEKYSASCEEDLAVVPALAVGRDFSRLGYGKGYYDRFLADFKGISVCPVYPQLICESVSAEKFDIPQKIILTPTESIRR